MVVFYVQKEYKYLLGHQMVLFKNEKNHIKEIHYHKKIRIEEE